MACGICKAADHNRRTCKLNPDYDPALGKVPTSELLITAARRNARLGGAPVQHKVYETFKNWPKPPADALARSEWYQNVLAELTYLQLMGLGSERMNDQIRRLAHASAELTPKERLWKAEQLIRGDTLRKKPKSNQNGTGALRGGSKPTR